MTNQDYQRHIHPAHRGMPTHGHFPLLIRRMDELARDCPDRFNLETFERVAYFVVSGKAPQDEHTQDVMIHLAQRFEDKITIQKHPYSALLASVDLADHIPKLLRAKSELRVYGE